jgi:hypothetical protein
MTPVLSGPSLACSGGIDLRAQAQVTSALRTDNTEALLGDFGARASLVGHDEEIALFQLADELRPGSPLNMIEWPEPRAYTGKCFADAATVWGGRGPG